MGQANLSGSRSHGYRATERGIRFTQDGQLLTSSVTVFQAQGLYDTGVSHWVEKYEEWSLTTRVMHLESGLSIATIIGKEDWNPDFDEQERSLAATDRWETMNDGGVTNRYIWFADPSDLNELAKLRFFFS